MNEKLFSLKRCAGAGLASCFTAVGIGITHGEDFLALIYKGVSCRVNHHQLAGAGNSTPTVGTKVSYTSDFENSVLP